MRSHPDEDLTQTLLPELPPAGRIGTDLPIAAAEQIRPLRPALPGFKLHMSRQP